MIQMLNLLIGQSCSYATVYTSIQNALLPTWQPVAVVYKCVSMYFAKGKTKFMLQNCNTREHPLILCIVTKLK